MGKSLDLKKFSLGDNSDELNNRRTVGAGKASDLDKAKKRGKGRGNSADRIGRAIVKDDDEQQEELYE